MPLRNRQYQNEAQYEGRRGEVLPTTLQDTLQAAADNPELRPTQIIKDVLQQNNILPTPIFGEQTDPPDPRDNEMMTPDQVKEQYGHLGVKFDGDVTRHKARFTAEGKVAERNRASVIQRGPKGIGAAAAQLGTGFISALFDPLNIAVAFIPIVGEARFAGMGITGARIAAGATNGIAGNALLEPFVYGGSKQLQLDYGMADALLNIGFGAGIGVSAHVVSGKVGDILFRRDANATIAQRSAFAQSIYDGHYQTLVGEAEGFHAALSQSLQDRPINIKPVREWDRLRYETTLQRIAKENPRDATLENVTVSSVRRWRSLTSEEGVDLNSPAVRSAEKEALKNLRLMGHEVATMNDIKDVAALAIFNKADPINFLEANLFVDHFNRLKESVAGPKKSVPEADLTLKEFVKIAKAKGTTPDDIASAAFDAGYFPNHSSRPTPAELKKALEADVEVKASRTTPEGRAVDEGKTGTDLDDNVFSDLDRMGLSLRSTEAEVRAAVVDELDFEARNSVHPTSEDAAAAATARPDLVKEMANSPAAREYHDIYDNQEIGKDIRWEDLDSAIKEDETASLMINDDMRKDLDGEERTLSDALDSFIDDVDQVDDAVRTGANCLASTF